MKLFWPAILLCVFLKLTAAPVQAGDEPVVVLSDEQVAAGTTLAVQIVSNTPLTDLTLHFGGRNWVPFSPSDWAPNHWLGLVAVPFETEPGPHALSARWKTSDGLHQQMAAFHVINGNYPTENLKVDPSRVNPSQTDRQRADQEREEVSRIYANGHPTPMWESDFCRPLDSTVTSPFGNRRLFNGKLASYHSGIDFRATVGTGVKAANRGTVRLAKDLFYAGKTVLIDHGAGVFTIYAHLSRFGVAVDQTVSRGQIIGWSGQSGRVSGPHLHWGLKLNGQNVDPHQFMEIISKWFQPPPSG